METIAPKFELSAFNCPFCNAYAHMDWISRIYTNHDYEVKSATCARCTKSSIWRSDLNVNNFRFDSKMIFPDVSISVIAETDMPDHVKVDFNEAKSIFNKSPRASAALLRLALQKLLKHLGEPGENINSDIKSLVSKGNLTSDIQRAADTIRITGNNAVHPGTMNDEDVDHVAAQLFGLINFIVKKTITEPKEIESLYLSTPESARAAIDRRDA
ncbi:DUF4145 domain-containing protein [Acinetobacter soli]|uniref:DUF4145 domain-containing protein n=1 Tax=Acinetobacter soli TaxID=487316 RepID=UPI001F204A91|nr:DUF4145 domain-containing protein [Acinetobacter soli]MCF3128440.1 DUF4145 domain-containing protein [Acinetobacter soli]